MTTADGTSAAARRPVIGGLIDVHHHFNPGGKDNEGKLWSVDMALDGMDASGIAVAVASLGPVNDGGSDARPARIRAWNEWGARACGDHPGRFGLFASLPLPDVDLALAEIAYAYDVLHVDGIGLSTNEGDIWLSDERNTPVLAELDRRKAVVFVHPAPTSRCRALGHAYGGDMIAPAWLEFPVNTARLVLGLLVKGVTRTYPGIRFILAHGGGVAPLVLGRVTGFAGWQTVGPETLARMFPDGIYAEFAKFYFECGQACAPEAFALLQRLAPQSHILFGSDFSYFPMAHSVAEFDALRLDDATRSAIGAGNAVALFPRLSF